MNNKIEDKALEKLGYARMRIISNHSFFAVLLFNVQFAFYYKSNITTDGKTIFVNPNFINRLTDKEIDIIILHELMHIILKHPFRYKKSMDSKLFHYAADIVVNSNILKSIGSFTDELYVDGRLLKHLTPDGDEGYLYSAEEVYKMLKENKDFIKEIQDNNSESDDEDAHDPDEIDSMEMGVSKENTIIKLKVKSSVNARLYLKQETFSEYNNGDFLKSRNCYKTKNNLLNPQLFTSYKLNDLNIKEESLNIDIVDRTYLYRTPIPIYPNIKNKELFNSDSETTSLKSLKYDIDFYPVKIDNDLIDKLNNINFNNKDISKEELEYRKYVYKNYLNVSNLHKKFFLNTLTKLKIDSNDPYIIIKLRNYVSTAAVYDANSKGPQNGEDKILYFLTKEKRGMCKEFASALTMFYRSIGIPSRIVGGFMKSVNKDTITDIYIEELHAWTEVYLDNIGWISIDPTPATYGIGSSSSEESNDDSNKGKASSNNNLKQDKGSFDSMDKWESLDDSNKNGDENKLEELKIDKLILDALNLNRDKKWDNLPGSIELIAKELTKPKLDWKVILNDFICEEVADYSFNPPDRRFSESNFILPDYNDTEQNVKDIIFMVDSSGSMSEKDILDCYTEINSAINQFNGKLTGHIGFFDFIVNNIYEMDESTDVLKLRPKGRGGTNFTNIFNYINDKLIDKNIASIIILTDGYSDFPSEDITNGIPVLWIINNEEVNPPFGKTIRLIN